jgi:hypothetical protein
LFGTVSPPRRRPSGFPEGVSTLLRVSELERFPAGEGAAFPPELVGVWNLIHEDLQLVQPVEIGLGTVLA